MRDFKYKQLYETLLPRLTPTIQNLYLQESFQQFFDNMMRAINLGVMPWITISHATMDAALIVNSHVRSTGGREMTLQELADWEFSGEQKRVFSTVIEEARASYNAAQQMQFHCKIAFPYLERTLDVDSGMREAVDAVYVGILLQSWTAFESFAADLWVAAVDNGPDRLIRQVLNSSGIKKPDDNITVRMLHDLQYDARTHVGSFLRDTRRVSFQTLKEIVKTYEIAFDKKGEKIFVQTNQNFIAALSAFRNVFAHKAGRIDGSFVKQIKEFPEFAHLKPPDIILLDGEVVAKLRNSAAHMAIALIKFVDGYISGL